MGVAASNDKYSEAPDLSWDHPPLLALQQQRWQQQQQQQQRTKHAAKGACQAYKTATTAASDISETLASVQQATQAAVDLYHTVAGSTAPTESDCSTASSLDHQNDNPSSTGSGGSGSAAATAAAAAAAAAAQAVRLVSHGSSALTAAAAALPVGATAAAATLQLCTAASGPSSSSSSRLLPPDLGYVQHVAVMPRSVEYGSTKAQGPRQCQEDHCVACSLPQLGAGAALVAVFDGHGGGTAATQAVSRVPELLEEHLADGDAAGFHSAFHAFDRWLVDQIQAGRLKWDRSGCTAVTGVCAGHELLVGNVGDSAALLIDVEGRVTRLSEAHNTFNTAELARVRASGAHVEMGRGCPVPRVWDRPPRNGGRGSMVTRALGDLDFKRAARGIINEPSVMRHRLRPGVDLALVTVSDGVTDVLPDAEIGRLVLRALKKNVLGSRRSSYAEDVGLGFAVASDVVVGAVVARSRDNMSAAAMVFDW